MPILSDKQKKFCDEYMIDLNATQAAIRAGYAPNSARISASRLIAKDNIQEYLSKQRLKSADKLEISRDKVLAEYAKIAFFDLRKIFTVDGGLKPVKDIDDESIAAIGGIETNDMNIDDIIVGKIQKVKIWDKRAALDSICKMLGYNAPEKLKMIASITDDPIVFE